MRPAIPFLFLAVALGACGEASGPPVTVEDSAGVEIVTNGAAAAARAATWSLSADPLVEIGAGANPEVPLFRVAAVMPLEEGGVAVGMNAPPRVLVFDRGGVLTATLGREGEGPGELSSVGSVVPLTADSIAIWDPDRRRISIFRASGPHIRDVDLSALAPATPTAAPTDRAAAGFTHLLGSESGSLVLFAEGVYDTIDAPRVGRPELPAWRITTEGAEVARLGSFPGMEVYFGSPLGTLPLPLGARTYAATIGDALVVGTAETTELRMFQPTGALGRIVRWPDHERTVGGAYLSAWSEMVEAQPNMRDIVVSLPRPERFPAYQGLIATDRGEILVADYGGPSGIWPMRRSDQVPDAFKPVRRSPRLQWRVFDADGVRIASLETPEGFEAYAVRGDAMWGVFTSDLEVESVRAYRLSRSP